MSENIKVTLDIEGNIEPTIANLKRLKLQLKDTADPAAFKELQQQIDDLGEAVGAAKIGAGNFADVLGKLPGPIGAIGGQVGGLVGGLKQFSQIKFNDIQGSFVKLGQDVKELGVGFANITGLTRVYTVATNGATKALNFFGVSTQSAATASKAFGLAISGLLAATGLIALTTLIQLASDAWTNYANKAERAEEAQKKLNEALLKGSKVALDAESASVKRTGDLLLAEAKARGANAAEIYKIEQTNRKLLLASQQRYYDDLKNKDSDEAIAAEERIKDTQNSILIAEQDFRTQQNQASKEQKKKEDADAAQKLEKQKQVNKQIADNEKAAAITLLDQRDQERRKIVNDYNEKIKLASANGKDTFILEEAKLKALGELNDKYRKEDNEKEREAEFQRLANLITDLDYENELLDNDFQDDLQRLSNKEAYIKAQKDLELSNTELTEKQRLDIIKKYADLERQIDKDITNTKKAEIEARDTLNLAYANSFAAIGRVLQQAAGDNKDLAIAGILVEQAAGVANIVINGKKNFIKDGGIKSPLAWANAAAAAAAVVAAGFAAKRGIDQIKNTPIPGGGGGGGGVGVSAPTYSGAPTMLMPQIQTSDGVNPTTQIAETLAGATKPLKAYIVSSEVSSQQALDRRTNVAATFSGG